ncbi:hypothetical protein KFE25_001062 [Diacronema lutheri]|uniref:Uncharacterized protein n=2 Tax=Diacronema lutheri TaxID=2081491 RepID=A0A8J5XD07_DIALT|nr:hypothetical protein KFE25_001062 [Diacronema lutheri]
MATVMMAAAVCALVGFSCPACGRMAAARARASSVVACAAVAASDDARVIGEHVRLDELSNEQLVRIVRLETTDEETNELAWRCLGYRRGASGAWDASDAFQKFRLKYPQPPDLIGVTRTYSKEIDEPVLRANQALHRSIPMAYKQGLKTQLKPLGFTGFKLANLTPNMTRRAQVTNWLLYYREALHGRTFGDVRRAKDEARQLEEAAAAQGVRAAPTGTSGQHVL